MVVMMIPPISAAISAASNAAILPTTLWMIKTDPTLGLRKLPASQAIPPALSAANVAAVDFFSFF